MGRLGQMPKSLLGQTQITFVLRCLMGQGGVHQWDALWDRRSFEDQKPLFDYGDFRKPRIVSVDHVLWVDK